MNNLFVMHTQYNLILSSGITSRNKSAFNVLVLYAEFPVTDEYVDTLNKIYNKVIVVNDRFRTFTSTKEELDFIRLCIKKCKEIKKIKFDNVYLSQERVFDSMLFYIVKRKNKNVRCYNVEEDAYYSINNKFNDDNYKCNITFTNKVKRFLKMIYVGHFYNYKECRYCYGMGGVYNGVNMLFPHLARRELLNKERIEITKEEILYGVNALYSNKNCNYPSGERYLVVFFDLINRYKNKDLVIKTVKELITNALEQGKTIILKYHPRETEKFTEFNSLNELDNVIPAEKVLYDLLDKEVEILGNATTAVIVSAKLGYKVNSICKIESPDNIKMHSAMTKMGINCIEN